MSSRTPPPERHTCTTHGGACALCPPCQEFRIVVQSHAKDFPPVLTCTHCDSPDAVANIQRGKPSAA